MSPPRPGPAASGPLSGFNVRNGPFAYLLMYAEGPLRTRRSGSVSGVGQRAGWEPERAGRTRSRVPGFGALAGGAAQLALDRLAAVPVPELDRAAVLGQPAVAPLHQRGQG